MIDIRLVYDALSESNHRSGMKGERSASVQLGRMQLGTVDINFDNNLATDIE